MLPASFKVVSDALDFTRRSVDRLRNGPNPYLSGNYAPVDRECAPTHVRVISGEIPGDLPAGVFLRNGPNPKRMPRGLYHWFDGDGRLHGIRIKDGEAFYCTRQTMTPSVEAKTSLNR